MWGHLLCMMLPSPTSDHLALPCVVHAEAKIAKMLIHQSSTVDDVQTNTLVTVR